MMNRKEYALSLRLFAAVASQVRDYVMTIACWTRLIELVQILAEGRPVTGRPIISDHLMTIVTSIAQKWSREGIPHGIRHWVGIAVGNPDVPNPIGLTTPGIKQVNAGVRLALVE